jgi:hypothetical protein
LPPREGCREVGEKLAGRPLKEVWCWSWRRYHGDNLVAVPNVPNDIWDAYEGGRLREVLEARLGGDWDQSQVHNEIESLGFTCGMTRRFPSREFSDLLDTPRFACIAQVGATVASKRPDGLLAYGADVWVEVQFVQHKQARRWQKIEVIIDGSGAF